MIFENQEYPDLPEGAVCIGRGKNGGLHGGIVFEGWAHNGKAGFIWHKGAWEGCKKEMLYAVPDTSDRARHAVPTGRNKLHIPLSEWPEWANWAVMDDSRQVWFYEKRPGLGIGNNWANQSFGSGGMSLGFTDLTAHITDWRESLTPRPVVGQVQDAQPDPADQTELQEARHTIADMEQELEHHKRIAAEWKQVSDTWRGISEKREEMYNELVEEIERMGRV